MEVRRPDMEARRRKMEARRARMEARRLPRGGAGGPGTRVRASPGEVWAAKLASTKGPRNWIQILRFPLLTFYDFGAQNGSKMGAQKVTKTRGKSD